MSSASDLVLAPMVRKLEYWNPLNEEERLAILGLPHQVRELKPHQFVIWDGDHPERVPAAVRLCLSSQAGRQWRPADPFDPHERRSD